MIAMAVSAAASAASAAQAMDTARRQAGAAQDAYDQGVVQIKNQQTEAGQAASSQMSVRAKQAMVETGHLQALSNESGTNGGGSNDRVTNEAAFNGGTDIATMQNTAASQQRALADQARGAYSTASQRMASIQQPSLVGTGLQIASSTTALYSADQAAKLRASGGVPAASSGPAGSNQYNFTI